MTKPEERNAKKEKKKEPEKRRKKEFRDAQCSLLIAHGNQKDELRRETIADKNRI